MKRTKTGTAAFIATAFLLCLLTPQYSWADTLSNAQNLMQQLQSQAAKNAANLSSEQQRAQKIQTMVNGYQGLIDQVNAEISTNKKDLDTTQVKLTDAQNKLSAMVSQLVKIDADYRQMIVVLYENGGVPYLQVLFGATSFSDLLSRASSLALITEKEHELGNQVISMHADLVSEERQEGVIKQSLLEKKTKLQSLQQLDIGLQNQQKMALTQANKRIQIDVAKQNSIGTQIQLTQEQINQMEQQISENEMILSTNAAPVNEPELRYQNIQSVSLYNYVHAHDSTFTLQDIQMICNAAQHYDISSALLIAITGQEQSFDPPGPDAIRIKNNPFNVFYSWQVYNTNLSDASNIAANTVRHKLSSPPPQGETPISWMNDPRNPWGIYATDPNWAYGVSNIFNSIMQYLQTGISQ